MPTSSTVIIATRGSALALAQANAVLARCRALFPDRPFEIRIFKTTGDKLQTAALASATLPKGLFTKELEVALLSGEAHLAVHSLKDLPTDLPEGLILGAVEPREDPRDVLVHRIPGGSARGFAPGTRLRDFPAGAVIATSSTRRGAQACDLHPGLRVVPIRGNVGTRLRKVSEDASMDATLLAAAGLRRLGYRIQPDGRIEGGPSDGDHPPTASLVAAPIPASEMIPCVGQAAVGIEIRAGDPLALEICSRLNDPGTRACVEAERSFLNAMGGGCQAAVAAHATLDGSSTLILNAVSYLGGTPQRATLKGDLSHPVALGSDMARALGGPDAGRR
ncbi:MAG TPA: hydroxymethylbilane synthase [Verrucomicrobiales bacterium]|nr:hydroxymethylbilane synthase [Verrucomicrobiales bacterium]